MQYSTKRIAGRFGWIVVNEHNNPVSKHKYISQSVAQAFADRLNQPAAKAPVELVEALRQVIRESHARHNTGEKK